MPPLRIKGTAATYLILERGNAFFKNGGFFGPAKQQFKKGEFVK